MMHYKRERSGRPLIDTRPAVGDVDGYGRYGILDDDGETVGCHECGARVAGLGNHAHAVHGVTARQYKLAHGLPLSRSLSATAYRETLSARARARVGGPGWAALEAARDPAAAAASRGPESFASAAVHRDPSVPVVNGRAARTGRVVVCPVCRASWCPLPGGYRAITCSPECQSTWQAWSAGSHQLKDPARDARIYAEVVRKGRPTREVAAEHGISQTRVQQIVRRQRDTDPGPAPDAQPDGGLTPSQRDAWWIARADAVAAHLRANGVLPHVDADDKTVVQLGWWLHRERERAKTPPPDRRTRYRRAYLDLVAPGWDEP